MFGYPNDNSLSDEIREEVATYLGPKVRAAQRTLSILQANFGRAASYDLFRGVRPVERGDEEFEMQDEVTLAPPHGLAVGGAGEAIAYDFTRSANAEVAEALFFDAGRFRQPREGPPGLFLYGPTGAGKTRLASAILLRELMTWRWQRDRRHTVASIKGQRLRHLISREHNAREAQNALAILARADAAFIDDLGHGTVTSTFLARLLELLDSWSGSGTRFTLTSQWSLEELTQRWKRSSDGTETTVDAIMRRLGEQCFVVNLPRGAVPQSPQLRLSSPRNAMVDA